MIALIQFMLVPSKQASWALPKHPRSPSANWTGVAMTNDGIDVKLLWNPRTDAIVIAVEDERAGDSFELAVDAVDALDAFRHPYAYA